MKNVLPIIESHENAFDHYSNKANFYHYNKLQNIKSPILQLKGLLLILKKSMNYDADTQNVIDMALSSNDAVYKKIANILEQDKGLELKNNLINFSVILNDIEDFFTKGKSESPFKIIRNIDGEVSYYSDQAILHTIIHKLIENIIKGCHEQGASCQVAFSVTKSLRDIVIRISDKGTSTDFKHLSKVFEIGQTDNNLEGGYQENLLLIKKSLDTLNGTLEVTAELDLGTTYTIKIPDTKSYSQE